MLTRLALPTLAAAAALLATAPLAHDDASARPAVWQPPSDGGIERLRRDNAQLRAQLDTQAAIIDEGLARLDNLARTIRDRRAGFRLRHAIDDLRSQLAGPDHWDDDGWSHQPDPWRPTPQPPQPPMPRAMDASDFQRLQAQLAATQFPTDQMNIIGAAAARNLFSVDQIVALMTALAFDDNRIEVAVLLAPRVVDPQRWHLVYSALAFASSRETLRQRVNL